jgi:ATP-binding cassette subfamily B protein
MIGTFYTSSDGFKFVVESINDSTANIRFINSGIKKQVSIATIKRFGVEEHANVKTESRFVHLIKNTYKSIYGSILTQSGIQFISTSITIAVLWVGSNLVIKQELTPGELMVFYSVIGYVLSPISSLITSNQTIQDALIAADRLFQIMDLEQEESDTDKIILESFDLKLLKNLWYFIL